MRMGKVVVRCPVRNSQVQVARPDSGHPFWSINKPEKDEGIVNVVEQVLECKNPKCASKFSVHWYDK